MIIAVAGHVDHGKTTLVRTLTGVDTDRLAEEKRRGLTIEPGFAYVGMGERRVGFVDVPGHHRFVPNMLTSLSALDAALLVVAADDGPMPQTREHLAILSLLDLATGIVVVSKVDAATPAQLADTHRRLDAVTRGTFLEHARRLEVSAARGLGVDALQDGIASLPARARVRGDGAFRMSVDRVFTLTGAGTVVAGAIASGRITVGDRLVLGPPRHEVRVRSLHANDLPVDTASVGERVAVVVGGVERAQAQRGMWLTEAGAFHTSTWVDGRLTLLGDAPALAHLAPVHIHHGASHVTGRLALLEGNRIEPGQAALAQLVCDQPLPAAAGDRIIVRDAASAATLGGMTVLDPAASSRSRRAPSRLRILAALATMPLAEAVAVWAREAPAGVPVERLQRGWLLHPDQLVALANAAGLVESRSDPRQPRLVDAGVMARLRTEVVERVGGWQKAYPHIAGIRIHQLRGVIRTPATGRQLTDALRLALDAGELVQRGATWSTPDFRPRLQDDDARIWHRIEPLLAAGPRPPVLHELARTLAIRPDALRKVLERLGHAGLIVAVSHNRWFRAGDLLPFAELAQELAAAGEGMFSAAQFRDRSALGRNLAIEVLEYFDRRGFTRRRGDVRLVAADSAILF